VAKHNALWFSGSTTGVNDDATLSWSLFVSDAMNNGVLNLLAHLQELFKSVYLRVFGELLRNLFFTPANNSLHFRKLIRQANVRL
jgi:hypothetical protein